MISKEFDSFLGDIVSHEEITGQLKIVSEIHVSKKGPYRIFLGERMGKRVILKTLKAEYLNDRQYLLMLRKEFEIAFSLSHPGIAAVYNYQLVDAVGECIIEEFIDGPTLEVLLLDGHEISFEKAVSILKAIAETLVYIHSKGIIHADLKPSNIIISNFDGSPKIIDFGFSDKLDYATLKFNGGTSGYIAPEKREKDYIPSPESDIWSMGEIIENLADKIKGREKNKLKKIAQKCKQPLGKRISSAEELLRLLLEARKSRKGWIITILAFAVMTTAISACIVLFVNIRKDNSRFVAENANTYDESVLKEIESNKKIPVIPEMITSENDGSLAESKIISKKTPQYLTGNSELLTTISKEEKLSREKINDSNSYKKEAHVYASQKIDQTITDLKEKGLYRKAKTIGEMWNSRFVYDEIIKDIEAFVDGMHIESPEVKAAVKKDAIAYARELLSVEEKKLTDSEAEQ